MIVSRGDFERVVRLLEGKSHLSLDTETSGLRPYHGDRLFSIIISDGHFPYYFSFMPYEGLNAEKVLLPSHLEALVPLLSNPTKTWYLHNAKYDMSILATEGLSLAGTIHCTQAMARVLYNEHQNYDLGACAERIGFKKDDTVDNYIAEHKLWDWSGPEKPGAREKLKHFDKVPFPLISKYGEIDGDITYRLARYQEATFAQVELEQAQVPPRARLSALRANEQRLTRTVFNMEQRGVLIDLPYCGRAKAYELDRLEKALQGFKTETGRDFSASNKLFQEIFASEKSSWEYGEETKTGQVNPTFDGDVLAKFKNPAARFILDYRDAKSKADFYQGFLYHADSSGVVHPSFNPAGAVTGRFSSSKPNFQNLTSEDDEAELAQEFVVRRAIIPRPGFFFILPDYDQVEYRLMFDTACALVGYETPLVKLINGGLDPHQATANLVTQLGFPLSRKHAKNGNFATLYGSGLDTLAATIGATREEARQLKSSIFKAAPELDKFIQEVKTAVRVKGFIRNWAGRRCYFPDLSYDYKAPNSLIQSGAADVNKIALNGIDECLREYKSKLVLTIHDENPCEVHESEMHVVPKLVKEIMESVYPHNYLPLTVGMEHSFKSLADKVKGYPK